MKLLARAESNCALGIVYQLTESVHLCLNSQYLGESIIHMSKVYGDVLIHLKEGKCYKYILTFMSIWSISVPFPYAQ